MFTFNMWVLFHYVGSCWICDSFSFLLGQNEIPFALYVEISFILFSCQIFIYIWHLFLNFRFSKGASIGIGIIESLLAALMLTGMGDVIWKYMPCAWGARLCNYFWDTN